MADTRLVRSSSRPQGSPASTRSMAQALVAIFIACITLSGCWPLVTDYDRATLVGQVKVGSPEIFRRSLTLPAGDAQLILAVPNYICAPIPDAKITFTVRSSKGVEFSVRRSLSELTWSHGRDRCNAYGYLRTNEMQVQIPFSPFSGSPIVVEIDTSEAREGAGRVALAWFVYGDRVPGAIIYGEFAEPIPGTTK